MASKDVTGSPGAGEKAQPMWGNALYQKRARKALPLLVKLASTRATATYTEIAKQLKMASARNLNYVLGSVGASLEELSKVWGEPVPPLTALVVNVHTDLPGTGVDTFLLEAGEPASLDRRSQVEQACAAIYEYKKWKQVQKALRGPPVAQALEAAADVAPADAAPRYWWVNHKKTHQQEVQGEYLWSPKRKQNGAQNESYDNMLRVMPGDLVFSFANAAVRAIGVALARARVAPQPADFGAVGEQWGTEPGWQVSVRFRELERPLRTKEVAAQLMPVLPAKYSPIRANGAGNQNTYLAAVPSDMADRLRTLLTGQVEELIAEITQTLDRRLAEDAAQEVIQQRTDIGPTEKVRLTNSRLGQGAYRSNLEKIEKRCRLTGVADRRLLRASHIKPWWECDDREKLDGYNGLLLSPHVDHLFDRGYISFSDEGNLLLSKEVGSELLEPWGIKLPCNVGTFRKEQRVYLGHHRRFVFEQPFNGKRGKGLGQSSPTEDPDAPQRLKIVRGHKQETS